MEHEPRPESGPQPWKEQGTETASAPTQRDPDLATLEGLEAELAELDAELARVERTDGEAAAPVDTGASPAATD